MKDLSTRQRQIADLVAAGHSDAEIADRLRISRSTVSSHKQHVYAKLNVHNAAQLVHALWKKDLPT
jgi:DNA-binding CsgD family transcriptional regulator